MLTIKSGLRVFLAQQTVEVLMEWFMEAAQQDGQLAVFLTRKMESSLQPPELGPRLRSAILEATTLPEELHLCDTAKIAAALERILLELEVLLQPKDGLLLVELSEYAIEQVEQALEQISDPNGDVGGVLESIGQLHLQACMLAEPDPVELAERLFRYENTFLFETFLDSARTYKAVLGEVGLQRFYELADAEWRRFGPLGHAHDGGFDNGRWRITHMMETLTQLTGDIEQWVAIKSRDLSSTHHYLQIAEMYQSVGRTELALDWAERGLHGFPERPDNRLRDFLASLYLEQGRNEDALELIWIQMESQPNLEHYRKLCDWSMKLDIWPLQRQRALARVMAVIEQEARMVSRWKPLPVDPDYSLLVDIALWENDLLTALGYVGRGQVRREVLINLAARLEQSQQDQAIRLYRQVLDASLQPGNDWGYLDMSRLLQKYADLMLRNDMARELISWLIQLRQQFAEDAALQKILALIRT
jgi:tetratricopeptide (TPR) repeat protein